MSNSFISSAIVALVALSFMGCNEVPRIQHLTCYNNDGTILIDEDVIDMYMYDNFYVYLSIKTKERKSVTGTCIANFGKPF